MLRLKKKNLSFSVECEEPEPLAMRRISDSCKDVLGRYDNVWASSAGQCWALFVGFDGPFAQARDDCCHCGHIAGGQSGQQSTCSARVSCDTCLKAAEEVRD